MATRINGVTKSTKPVRKRVSRKKYRVPRTHAGGTWTKARYFQFIRSALRQAFTRYPPKYQAKKAAERTVKGKRHRYEYQCALCQEWYKGKEVDVDHMVPAGSLQKFGDLPGFVKRLFCEADELQVLCKPCHKLKTKEERDAKKALSDT